jgi:hypothetical protein
MTGPERVMLYRLAVETGLRANELRTLKVSSFDLNKGTVTVRAGYSKRKREDVLPLRPDTAAELREFLSSKLPGARAFKVPGKPADMLRADLAEVGIPYVDQTERYADFHALRHTTGTWLAANGVHPKVAQAIMRHSDINLTMARYTHTLRGQEAEAVKSLPDLSLPKDQAVRATGTDGREELTPQLTPPSTPAAFSECSRLAAGGVSRPSGEDETALCKHLEQGRLDTESELLTPVVTGKNEKPTDGFEPSTPGLQNQSSTVELRWRCVSAEPSRSDQASISAGGRAIKAQSGLDEAERSGGCVRSQYRRAGRWAGHKGVNFLTFLSARGIMRPHGLPQRVSSLSPSSTEYRQ